MAGWSGERSARALEQLRHQIERAREQDIVQRSRVTVKKLSNLTLEKQAAAASKATKVDERH